MSKRLIKPTVLFTFGCLLVLTSNNCGPNGRDGVRPTPPEQFAPGAFTEMKKTSPAGYTADTPGELPVSIVIYDASRVEKYSYSVRGRGISWEVYFNQVIPDSAIILERGVTLTDPPKDQGIDIVRLDQPRSIATDTKPEFEPPFLQSQDGKVLAVVKQTSIPHQSPAEFRMDYYEALAPTNQPALIGNDDISDCSFGNIHAPQIEMKAGNLVSMPCGCAQHVAGPGCDPNRETSTHLIRQ